MSKAYLGDGLYIDKGPYPGAFTLTAENGIDVQDRIILDGSTIRALADYIHRSGPTLRDVFDNINHRS